MEYHYHVFGRHLKSEAVEVPTETLVDLLKQIGRNDVVYLVEQNRDGQMAAIFKAEWPDLGSKIVSILIYDGLPITAGGIVKQIKEFQSSLGKEVEKWPVQRPIASI